MENEWSVNKKQDVKYSRKPECIVSMVLAHCEDSIYKEKDLDEDLDYEDEGRFQLLSYEMVVNLCTYSWDIFFL